MPATASSTFTAAKKGDREIVLTREFDAPRDLVFKTMTDPTLIPKWWGPRRYTTIVDKAGQVRPVENGRISEEQAPMASQDAEDAPSGVLMQEPLDLLHQCVQRA